MDLKTFISDTLVQITEGVADAAVKIREGGSNARLNPADAYSSESDKSGRATPVEFDVALVVADETKDGSVSKLAGSAGLIAVVTAKVSSDLRSENVGSKRNETVSRLKFTVMLAQPADVHIRPEPRIPTSSRRVV